MPTVAGSGRYVQTFLPSEHPTDPLATAPADAVPRSAVETVTLSTVAARIRLGLRHQRSRNGGRASRPGPPLQQIVLVRYFLTFLPADIAVQSDVFGPSASGSTRHNPASSAIRATDIRQGVAEATNFAPQHGRAQGHSHAGRSVHAAVTNGQSDLSERINPSPLSGRAGRPRL